MMIKNNQILAGTETCFLSARDVFYLYLLPLFHLYALCSLLFAIYIKKKYVCCCCVSLSFVLYYHLRYHLSYCCTVRYDIRMIKYVVLYCMHHHIVIKTVIINTNHGHGSFNKI